MGGPGGLELEGLGFKGFRGLRFKGSGLNSASWHLQ